MKSRPLVILMIVIALGVSACGLFPGGREDKETMKSVTEAEAVLESLTFQFLDNAKGPRETSAGSADDAEESPFVICIRRRAEKGAAELSLRDPKHLAGEDVKPSLMLGEDFLDKIAALIREGGLQEARQRGDREMPAGSKRATCLTTQFRGKDVATVRSSDRMTPAEEDAYYKVFNALMRAFRLGEDPFLAEEPGAPGSWLLESVSCERFGGFSPSRTLIEAVRQANGDEVLLSFKKGGIINSGPPGELSRHTADKRFLDEIQSIILDAGLHEAWVRPRDGLLIFDRSEAILTLTFRGREPFSIASSQILSSKEKAAFNKITKMLNDKIGEKP
ncbi:MAG TPA: hypothetical protein PKH23_00480 [Bacillota bacterium]|nr:hypothetical protein [Bacillota bacterium]